MSAQWSYLQMVRSPFPCGKKSGLQHLEGNPIPGSNQSGGQSVLPQKPRIFALRFAGGPVVPLRRKRCLQFFACSKLHIQSWKQMHSPLPIGRTTATFKSDLRFLKAFNINHISKGRLLVPFTVTMLRRFICFPINMHCGLSFPIRTSRLRDFFWGGESHILKSRLEGPGVCFIEITPRRDVKKENTRTPRRDLKRQKHQGP